MLTDLSVLFLVGLQYRQEGLLRYFDVTYHLHPLLTFLLLLKQLSLPGDIASVTLRRYILSVSGNRLTGNNVSSDGTLNGDLELLTGNLILESLTHLTSAGLVIVLEDQLGKGINGFPVDQDVESHEIGLLVSDYLVVEGGISP